MARSGERVWENTLKRIEQSALVPYSAAQMFALVNDIESYPHYMTGCVGAEIVRKGEGWLDARLDLSRMGIKQSFTTHNTLEPPQRIHLSLVKGPFSALEGEWQFRPLDERACRVEFWLEFQVNNPLLALALPKLMRQLASEQVSAVCERARQIYAAVS